MFPLLKFEKEALLKGYKYIAGIDEVGRGPLAGPMVVAAVILNIKELLEYEKIEGFTNNDVVSYSKINDSKKLTQKARESLETFIKSKAISYKIVEVSNNEIDAKGISQITQYAFFKAVSELHIKADYIITDNFPILKIVPYLQTNLPKGDTLSMSVAAASIIAKVYRDALMRDEHNNYPDYGFDKHKGYGTAEHIAALKKYGPCPLHRISFEPVKSLYHSKVLS
ncbi:ribonuclease HII [candidate division WWE3 bacterium]|uniref:Ribonuclease HII n=1 Tax=candidate division WWE3 bacterium TaxID=2053526 RepID=A0A7X9DK25_UNCKA|nr:ribonuclease HII [candidate division WWE3 bacterium]